MWDSAHSWRRMTVAGQANAVGKKSNQRQGTGYEGWKYQEERAAKAACNSVPSSWEQFR